MRDNEGRRTDCHFFTKSTRRSSCSALVDFYNAQDPADQCGRCPFFKTDEEFNNGWKRRLKDVEGMQFTEAV